MKNLAQLETFNTDHSQPEWIDQLQELLIKPLAKQGFTFKGYGHQYDPETTLGMHTLIFDHETDQDISPDAIGALMFDDCSQPCSIFQIHFGSLWVCIPYQA